MKIVKAEKTETRLSDLGLGDAFFLEKATTDTTCLYVKVLFCGEEKIWNPCTSEVRDIVSFDPPVYRACCKLVWW